MQLMKKQKILIEEYMLFLGIKVFVIKIVFLTIFVYNKTVVKNTKNTIKV